MPGFGRRDNEPTILEFSAQILDECEWKRNHINQYTCPERFHSRVDRVLQYLPRITLKLLTGLQGTVKLTDIIAMPLVVISTKLLIYGTRQNQYFLEKEQTRSVMQLDSMADAV